jgi:integrase
MRQVCIVLDTPGIGGAARGFHEGGPELVNPAFRSSGVPGGGNLLLAVYSAVNSGGVRGLRNGVAQGFRGSRVRVQLPMGHGAQPGRPSTHDYLSSRVDIKSFRDLRRPLERALIPWAEGGRGGRVGGNGRPANRRGRHTSTKAPTAALQALSRAYAAAARAPSTQALYRYDFEAFVAWCEAQALLAMPAAPDTVALYLTFRVETGWKALTIGRALTGISQAHKAAGFASPRSALIVQEVLKGIRRKHGAAPVQKAPILLDDLKAMVRTVRPGLIGLRDRAMLLLGFAGAFRRSELAFLDVSDLAFSAAGLEVTLRRSKTDQEGAGRKVGIPHGSVAETCPIGAVKGWLDAAGITEGPILREVPRFGTIGTERLSGLVVARVVKRAARAAGLDPQRFSGHSLRAGLATSAAKAGKSERAIMKQTGHRSAETVRRYIRDADLFRDNAAAGIGL